jgi:hypothetical protein
MFYLLMPSLEKRQALIAHLKAQVSPVCFIICHYIYRMWDAIRRSRSDCA